MDLRGDVKHFRVIGPWLPNGKGADHVSVVEQSPTYWVKQKYLLEWDMGIFYAVSISAEYHLSSIHITEKKG